MIAPSPRRGAGASRHCAATGKRPGPIASVTRLMPPRTARLRYANSTNSWSGCKSPIGPTQSYPHVRFDYGFRREGGLVLLTMSFVDPDPERTCDISSALRLTQLLRSIEWHAIAPFDGGRISSPMAGSHTRLHRL